MVRDGAIEEVEAGVYAGRLRADVQPDEAFGGTADGNAELINGQATGEVFDIDGVATGASHFFELGAGIDDADGVKVEAFDFGGSECAWDVGMGIGEGDNSEAFTGLKVGEKRGEVFTGGGGAVENLVSGVVFDGGPALTGGAIPLFEVRVEIPDPIYEFGDLARAAEIGGEFVNAGRGDFGMEDIVEPAPFEIGGADGLSFVTGDEDRDGATAQFLKPLGELSDEESFDGSEVLAFVDGDAIPGKFFGGNVWELLNGGPGEMEVREEAGGDGAAGLFEALGC